MSNPMTNSAAVMFASLFFKKLEVGTMYETAVPSSVWSTTGQFLDWDPTKVFTHITRSGTIHRKSLKCGDPFLLLEKAFKMHTFNAQTSTKYQFKILYDGEIWYLNIINAAQVMMHFKAPTQS